MGDEGGCCATANDSHDWRNATGRWKLGFRLVRVTNESGGKATPRRSYNGQLTDLDSSKLTA